MNCADCGLAFPDDDLTYHDGAGSDLCDGCYQDAEEDAKLQTESEE